MSTFFNCKLNNNLKIEDNCNPSEGIGGISSPLIIYNISDVDDLIFENDSRVDGNLMVENIKSSGKFYLIEFDSDSATYQESFDDGKWTHNLTLSVPTIAHVYEELLVDSLNSKYLVCFKPKGAEDYRCFGWKFGASLNYSLNIGSDSRGYNMTITDESEYPLLSVQKEVFGDKSRVYTPYYVPNFDIVSCELDANGMKTGYIVASFVEKVNENNQPLDAYNRMCQWTQNKQQAYKYNAISSDGNYQIIGTYDSDATFGGIPVKELDYDRCSAEVIGSITLSQKKNHAISLNSTVTSATFVVESTAWWAIEGYPKYHTLSAIRGESGQTTITVHHNGIGGSEVIYFQNLFTKEIAILTVTSNIIKCNDNYNISSRTKALVVTPIVGGCSSNYTYSISPSTTIQKDDIGNLLINLSSTPTAYTLTLEHSCDSSERKVITINVFEDENRRYLVLQYSLCVSYELRTDYYQDINPKSPTYGRIFEDTNFDMDCKDRDSNFVKVTEFCELDANGNNTGLLIEVYQDTNPNSPSYNKQLKEKVPDEEKCPVQSTEPNWTIDSSFVSYCETKTYQPSGVQGNTGNLIVRMIDSNPYSESFGDTQYSATTSPECIAPDTTPMMQEQSYQCELVDGNQNGYAQITYKDMNVYSSTYGSTEVIRRLDERCSAPIVTCNCDSLIFNGTPIPDPQPTDYFTVSVSVTNNTNKQIFLDRIELSYQLDDVELTSQFELAPSDTIVQGGEEIPQGHEGNTIYTVGVTYVVEGHEYSKLLLPDEWWCTSGKELGEGDTLFIELNNI